MAMRGQQQTPRPATLGLPGEVLEPEAANFYGKWSEGSIEGTQFVGNNGTICKVEYDERDASKVFLITEHRTYTGTLSGSSLCWDDGDTWHRIEEACPVASELAGRGRALLVKGFLENQQDHRNFWESPCELFDSQVHCDLGLAAGV